MELRTARSTSGWRSTAARARVGITDFAQDALGDVVYVQLPEVGLEVLAHASCAEVESTKSVSEIYAPVTGTVVEVNAALVDEPELVNQDPYGRGWILRGRARRPDEVDVAARRRRVPGARRARLTRGLEPSTLTLNSRFGSRVRLAEPGVNLSSTFSPDGGITG